MALKISNFIFKRGTFNTGAAILAITTFFSYVTGLMRDRLFAHTFGAGRELDLYNASFIIPDLLLNILVSSALSAAFIPVFTSLFANGDNDEANQLANTVLHSAVFVILIAGGLAAIFMPALARFIAPGFSAAEREILVNLSRLMLISPLIMAISNTFGAMLISYKSFFYYGISPILYNFGIIAGVFLIPKFSIYGLVIGTLIGATAHLLPRFWGIKRSPFRYEFETEIKDRNFSKVVKLMIPKMVGHPVEQFTFLAFTRVATLLAAGSVTAVSFARNFQSVPVSLFGIAFSVAIFPILSECAGKADCDKFLKNFWAAFRNILLFTVPSAIGLFLLSDLPIRIFLGGGRFSDENILRTASVLAVFALSIPTESLVHLLARSFYALKNTLIPVILSVVNFGISVSFAFLKVKTIGILAIPYGFFLGSLVEVILLSIILQRKIKVLRQASLLARPVYSQSSSRE